MAIDPKKYTRAELAKMVEDAQRSNGALEVQISGLCAQIDKKNDALSEYANEKEKLKADADVLRSKLADTEAALGRANACIATMKVERDQQTKDLFQWRSSAQALHDDLLDARERAHYAEAHPWRNLWAWVKRKAARHE